MACFKTENLKRGYIDPDDLEARLRKLKPSENYQYRPEYRHERIDWLGLPVRNKEHKKLVKPHLPTWMVCSFYYDRQHIGWEVADRLSTEMLGRWDRVVSEVYEEVSMPDSHLLRDMGHSPGGTLFPRELVRGLYELRTEADDAGVKVFDGEEFKLAEKERMGAVRSWQDTNPDVKLRTDSVSEYLTWPTELRGELEEIDKEAAWRGARTYAELLVNAERKLRELVGFWRDAGLITGQRTPPASWWLISWKDKPDTKASVRWPPKLKKRLDSIDRSGAYWDEWQRMRAMEFARWKEAIINTGNEPSDSDKPFPQPLLDNLDHVWQQRDIYELDVTENDLMDTIGRWRGTWQQHPSADHVVDGEVNSTEGTKEDSKADRTDDNVEVVADDEVGDDIDEPIDPCAHVRHRTRPESASERAPPAEESSLVRRNTTQAEDSTADSQVGWAGRLRPRKRPATNANPTKPAEATRPPKRTRNKPESKAANAEETAEPVRPIIRARTAARNRELRKTPGRVWLANSNTPAKPAKASARGAPGVVDSRAKNLTSRVRSLGKRSQGPPS